MPVGVFCLGEMISLASKTLARAMLATAAPAAPGEVLSGLLYRIGRALVTGGRDPGPVHAVVNGRLA